MISVYVRISKLHNELPGFRPSDLCDHARQQRIRGNVKRNTQTQVSGPLIHETTEPILGARRTADARKMDVELAKHMTGRQGHLREVCRNSYSPLDRLNLDKLTCGIPGTHDDSTISWVFLDLSNDLFELVDTLALVIGVAILIFRAEMAPLKAINGAKITLSSMA